MFAVYIGTYKYANICAPHVFTFPFCRDFYHTKCKNQHVHHYAKPILLLRILYVHKVTQILIYHTYVKIFGIWKNTITLYIHIHTYICTYTIMQFVNFYAYTRLSSFAFLSLFKYYSNKPNYQKDFYRKGSFICILCFIRSCSDGFTFRVDTNYVTDIITL